MSEYKWDENEAEIEQVEVYCGVTDELTPCNFPYCENDLTCEKEETEVETVGVEAIQGPVGRCTLVPTKLNDESDINKFFQYQKRLNDLEKEKIELEKNKKEVFQKVKTEIETIFLALDCDELGTKIELTKNGLTISYPVRVLNDYQTMLLDTELFTQLNNLMGMTGKLNMVKSTKQAGNHVYILEIKFDLKIEEDK